MTSRPAHPLRIHGLFSRTVAIADPEAEVQALEQAPADAEKSFAKHPAGTASDRRRRWRARIEGRAQIRGSVGTLDAFEDVTKTIDVSRDGLLFSTSRGGYWVGQPLQVAFPFWTAPTAINTARRATVVRSLPIAGFRYAVAIRFETQADRSLKSALSGDSGHVKVLGIQSNTALARELQNRLEQDGYKVVLVSSTEQAMDVMESEIPDVLVAEAEGPSMRISGRELCSMVKRTHRFSHIPVILLTNSALPSDYSASRRAGAVMCIPIPCDAERVQRSIHLVAPPPGHRSAYSNNFNVSSFVRTS